MIYRAEYLATSQFPDTAFDSNHEGQDAALSLLYFSIPIENILSRSCFE
jgi:hypothetical protein